MIAQRQHHFDMIIKKSTRNHTQESTESRDDSVHQDPKIVSHHQSFFVNKNQNNSLDQN